MCKKSQGLASNWPSGANGDKESAAYLLDLDELNPLRYKIMAGSIASLFEHEIKIERGSHVHGALIRDPPHSCAGLFQCDPINVEV